MKIHQELLNLRDQERRITSKILDKLQLLQDCKGYLKMGYSSLFDYLVRGLKYSETTAYQRQTCVRLTVEVPEIKDKIDEGSLSVSSLSMVYKHIKDKTIEDKRDVLKKM